jgi:UDP-N-acetylmuramoylalanine--D-glutamate ligase
VAAGKGFLSEWRGGRQVGSIDLRPMLALPGRHNHQNACAAYATARALGLGPRQIAAGFKSYPGLPHRSQLIATWKGVRIVNDSKATNADAAAQALASFERVRWIAGGRPKEGGIEALRPLFGRIAKAYLIGEAADAFAATLGETPHTVSGTVEAAVAAALEDALEGEVLLLAPACASFDQFPDFEARGAAFVAAVQQHIGAG